MSEDENMFPVLKSLRVLLIAVFCSMVITGCAQDLGDTKGDGVQEGLGVDEPQNIEPEFLGVWIHTVMSIQDGEPFVVSMETAIRIEKALRETEADGRPLSCLLYTSPSPRDS